MPRETMIWNAPVLRIALTQAALATGLTAECQTTRAELTPSANFNTIPATGCAGATQSPGLTGWKLELAWLQDWIKADAQSLSKFSYVNDGQIVWAQLIPNINAPVGITRMSMIGQFYASAGGFGAVFGDGSPGATTASWPALDKPVIAALTP